MGERHRRLGRSSSMAVFVACCMIAAAASVSQFARARFGFGAFDFTMGVGVPTRAGSWGTTILEVPPAGSVEAHTHRGPLALWVRLDGIDPDKGWPAVSGGADVTNLISGISRAAVAAVPRLSALMVASGILGACFASLALGKRGVKHLLAACIAGTVVSILPLSEAWATYNPEAFRGAEYRGIIQAAPWMVGYVEGNKARVSDSAAGIAGVLRELSRVQTDSPRAAAVSSGGCRQGMLAADSSSQNSIETLRIMHVSDIHNSQTGIDLISSIAHGLGVDAIIDTGDLTDLGTAFESSMASRVGSIGIPYFFAAGNHDSNQVVHALLRFPSVHVLNGIYTFRGLSIVGAPDPASGLDVENSAGVKALDESTDDKNRASAEGSAIPEPQVTKRQIMPASEDLAEVQRKLALNIDAALGYVDIVAVHNRKAAPAQAIDGGAQAVLFGHDHTASCEVRKVLLNPSPDGSSVLRKTVLLDAGTTGASGVRGLGALYGKEKPSHSLAILGFERSTVHDGSSDVGSPEAGSRWRLAWVDQVGVSADGARFRVERMMISCQ